MPLRQIVMVHIFSVFTTTALLLLTVLFFIEERLVITIRPSHFGRVRHFVHPNLSRDAASELTTPLTVKIEKLGAERPETGDWGLGTGDTIMHTT